MFPGVAHYEKEAIENTLKSSFGCGIILLGSKYW